MLIAVSGKRKPCKQAERRRDNLVLVVIDRCPFNVILPSFLPLANIEVKGRPLAAVNSLPFPICFLFIALSLCEHFFSLPAYGCWLGKSLNIHVASQGPNHKILSTIVCVNCQEGRTIFENTCWKCPCLLKIKKKGKKEIFLEMIKVWIWTIFASLWGSLSKHFSVSRQSRTLNQDNVMVRTRTRFNEIKFYVSPCQVSPVRVGLCSGIILGLNMQLIHFVPWHRLCYRRLHSRNI